MKKVINSCGAAVDYAAAVALMDAETAEKVHTQIAPCTPQDFFTAYCAEHLAKFGEMFELDKINPVY